MIDMYFYGIKLHKWLAVMSVVQWDIRKRGISTESDHLF